HRRAVVVRGVQQHGLGRDAGQGRDAVPGRLGDVPRHPQEVGSDERQPAASIVEDERLREKRLVDTLRAAGPAPPSPGLDAKGGVHVDATDAGTKPHSQPPSVQRPSSSEPLLSYWLAARGAIELGPPPKGAGPGWQTCLAQPMWSSSEGEFMV